MNPVPAQPRQSASGYGDLADRILDAARRLLVLAGARRMSMADVATLAGVSRPTIYRYFASKDDLIDALGAQERRRFDGAMHEAMAGVTGAARLEAAVGVVVSFVEEQPPGRQLDLDPGFALEQMAQALPMISERLVAVLQQCAHEGGIDGSVSPRCLAGAIARVALSHYMFPDADATAVRRQIRAAAGLPEIPAR